MVEHNRRSKTRKRKKPVRNEALQAGAKLEVPVEMVDISGPDYLKVLTDPKYGYGACGKSVEERIANVRMIVSV